MAQLGDYKDELVRPPRVGPSVVLASLTINVLALVLPVTLLQIFDRIVPYQAFGTMAVLFWALIAAGIADFVLKVARIILLGQTAMLYEMRLGQSMLRRMLFADSFAFASDTFGTHTDRLGAIRQLRDFYGGQGRLLSIDLPFAAVFVVMIWLIGGWLVSVPIGCAIAIWASSRAVRRWQERVLDDRRSVDQRRFSFLAEVLDNITIVKALAAEEQMLRRFDLLQEQSSETSVRLIRVAALSQILGAVFGQLSMVALAGVGAFLAIKGHIGMPELAACMLLNGRTVQPMLKLLSLWIQMEGVSAARKRVAEVAAIPGKNHEALAEGYFKAAVRFDNVAVHPKNRKDAVFSGLSFSVEPGQIATIKGDDGSGRSTVMRLILGEQAPDEGSVRIGGYDPIALADRRGIGEIGYVDQEPAIFAGSILENIALFGGSNRQDAAMIAAEKIGLDRDIFALPYGYDTLIGPGGQGYLPSGILQKIAIARVLSRHPTLLLFNNAATAIDGSARDRVREALLSLRGTTTVIAVTQGLFRPSDLDVVIRMTSQDAASETLARWIDDGLADASAPMRLAPGKPVNIAVGGAAQ